MTEYDHYNLFFSDVIIWLIDLFSDNLGGVFWEHFQNILSVLQLFPLSMNTIEGRPRT